jgi:hypothetical protein
VERDYGALWEYVLAFLTEHLSLSGLISARSISRELSYANFPSLWRYWPLGNCLVAITVVLFPNIVVQPHRIQKVQPMYPLFCKKLWIRLVLRTNIDFVLYGALPMCGNLWICGNVRTRRVLHSDDPEARNAADAWRWRIRIDEIAIRFHF